MKIFIASSEKYVGKIQEDIFLRDMYISKGYESEIFTLKDILKVVDVTDIVVLKSIWGYHLNYEEFLSQISTLDTKNVYLVNNLEFITWNINKYQYLSDIKELGVVPTKLLSIKDIDGTYDLISDLSKDLGESLLVIKPNISASGYLTYLYDVEKDNTNIITSLLEHKHLDFIIQPYRDLVVEGEISVILINGKTLYGIKRFPGVLVDKKNSEFIDMKNIPDVIHYRLKRLEKYFIEKFNIIPSICRVDFLRFKDTYEISEIELIDPDLFFRYIPEDVRGEAFSQFYAMIHSNMGNKIKKLDWVEFISNTKDIDPRPLTKKALTFLHNKKTALDIGGGSLNDTKYLLENGFLVDVVDSEQHSFDISRELKNIKLNMFLGKVEDYDMGIDHYDLVVANYVLPFIKMEMLSQVMKNIYISLRDKGVFCGIFFGHNDFFRNNPEILFNTKEEVLQLIDEYEILYFAEVQKKSKNYDLNQKNYHSFEFIVRKKELKYRKGTAVLVINEKKEILLVNLESFDEKSFTLPGGGQENGESLLETSYRELYEELNISKEDLSYINQSSRPVVFNFVKPKIKEGVEYVGSEKYYFGFTFVGDVAKIIPNPGEVRTYKWVKKEDLKNYLLFESQLTDTLQMIEEIL